MPTGSPDFQTVITSDELAEGAVNDPSKMTDGVVTAIKVAADVATQAELDAHGATEWHDAHPTPTTPVDLGGQVLQNVGAPVAATDGTPRSYVDSVAAGLDHQDSVLDRDSGGPPGAPNAGDRYIVDQATGDWSTASVDDIAEYDGAAWSFQTPNEGASLQVEDEDVHLVHTGTTWVTLGSLVDADQVDGAHAGTVPTAGQIPVADGAGHLDIDWIADGAVSAAKVASDVATQAELDGHAALDKSDAHPGVLETADLADAAVTAAKVASDVATQAELDAHGATEWHDAHPAPTTAVSLNGQKITDLAAPTLAADAARKTDVDTVQSNLDTHDGQGVSAAHGNVQTTDVADNAITAAKVASDVATQAELDAHTGDTGNPHNVTTGQIGAVPTTRSVGSGTGLTGGGALSQDRTLSLSAEERAASHWSGGMGDQSANRELGTSYQAGGTARWVSLVLDAANNPIELQVSSDGAAWVTVGFGVRNDAFVGAIVPPNWHYRATQVGGTGSPTIQEWAEGDL